MKKYLGALLAVVISSAVLAFPVQAAEAPEEVTIAGAVFSAENPAPVQIDANIFIPETVPAPAVVLAHGFGGSKNSMTKQAEKLQAAGYVVLTYSARGFGKTLAPISMNSPAYEIADAKALIDYLAGRPEVKLDAPNDPVVGFAGGSYGGALSLLIAGQDARVDAIAADITWNSLESALFPEMSNSGQSGVFKQLWTSFFFSVGMATPPDLINPCGRFSAEWCAAYTSATFSGELDPAFAELMAASSPTSYNQNITAPTLLMQGQADSLFPLSESTATYNEIKSANPDTPVKMVWHGGGHDGGLDETDRLDELVRKWFDTHLFGEGVADTNFEVTLRKGSVISTNSEQQFEVLTKSEFPTELGFLNAKLIGNPQKIVRPAGAVPAIITVLPGVNGTLSSLLGQSLPNQSAFFETEPFTSAQTVVGASKVKLEISASAGTEVVLFVSLRVVGEGGREVFPNGLVSPIRVQIGETPTMVEVDLPSVVQPIGPGEKLRLVVSTTDFGYRLPQNPAEITVSLTDNEIQIATGENFLVSNQSLTPAIWVGGALAFLLLVAGIVQLLRPRSRVTARPDLADVPIQIEHLSKDYKNSVRAVDDVSWRVPTGEVVGLLGPNGAGKTTTMRMIMGLIQPSSGNVFVYGEPVIPGSPVLARVGALVEGAGFLPHLTGRENLDLFWQASGRTQDDANLERVLEIADLGTAVDRKVRTYSQGMRQRLGIAQAMMGMPDVLLLDEPTNGLDPQQIKAMREVMQKYAATGRTVIVSSHMLSEVEQTCSYVIVMHRGKLITTGKVQDLLAGKTHMRLEDFFLEAIGDDLTIGKEN